MERFFFFSAAIIIGVLSLVVDLSIPPSPASDHPQQPSLTLDGKVIRVIDGDTIIVETKSQFHIRLIDCWAPESRTSDIAEKQRGLRSKNRMIQLAEGRSVRVSVPLTGDLTEATTMSRVLGRVWLNVDGVPQSVDLSSQMVSEGLATKTKELKESKEVK